MTIDSADPPRIDEHEPQALLQFVRGPLARGPSDAAVDRMSNRLAAAIQLSPSSYDTYSCRRERIVTYGKFGMLVSVAVALLSWRAMQEWRSTAETAKTARVVSRSVDRTAISSEAAQPSNAPATAPEPSTHSDAIAISVDSLPSAAPARVVAPGPEASVARPIASAKAPLTELEHIKRAQALLASDPESALSITREHARAYPSGEFVQEREVIAVEALSISSRREEALQRACALVQRFPSTPYGTRLEVAVGRPLSSILDCADAPSPKAPDGSHSAGPNP